MEINAGLLTIGSECLGEHGKALQMAYACWLAYQSETLVKGELEGEGLGYIPIRAGNASALLLFGDKMESIILAFTGTNSFPDWLEYNLKPCVHEGAHRGFKWYTHSLIQPTLHALAEAERHFPDKPLWVCGHSLGGAAAQIAAVCYLENVKSCYAFNAPRGFSRINAKEIRGKWANVVRRYELASDIISLFPFGFRNIGKCYWLRRGTVEAGSDRKPLWKLFQKLTGFTQWGRSHCIEKVIEYLAAQHEFPQGRGSGGRLRGAEGRLKSLEDWQARADQRLEELEQRMSKLEETLSEKGDSEYARFMDLWGEIQKEASELFSLADALQMRCNAVDSKYIDTKPD